MAIPHNACDKVDETRVDQDRTHVLAEKNFLSKNPNDGIETIPLHKTVPKKKNKSVLKEPGLSQWKIGNEAV